jgi:diguanylate cyclase (GGDEF)-like protein
MVAQMSQSISRLGRTRTARPTDPQNAASHASDLLAPVSSQMDSQRVLAMGKRRPGSDEHLGELLSTVLPSQDSELAHIVVEMVQMSRTLKNSARNVQTLTDALKRVVQCAVKQCLLDRELRSLALADDLTGLYNRRAFLTLASQQLKLSRRNAQGLLLFFVDVDNLKHINDSFGHHEGDLAILRVADTLEDCFRDSDIIARIGGDEFVVLALETCGENQEAILRRLETGLGTSNARESRYQVSLSVGVAKFDPKHPVSLGDLVSIADRMMYAQKRDRRKSYASQS